MRGTGAAAVLAVLGLTLAAGAGEVENRIAVMDMEAVMAAHPETEQAQRQLKKDAESYEAEKDELLGKFDRLRKEYEEAVAASESRALSEEGRSRKKEEAADKLEELRNFDKEIRETTLLRQRQLADRKRLMRDRIVGKIKRIVAGYAEAKGLVVVIDSGAVMDNPGAVVYNIDKLDITQEIKKLVAAEKADAASLDEKADVPGARVQPEERKDAGETP